MNEQTTAELEREAERARARIADTAETIKGKLTAGQLIDEFSNMFSYRPGSNPLGAVADQIRDNPAAIAMVAAGITWLALGRGRSDWVASGMSGSRERTRAGAGDAMRSMGSAVGNAAGAIKDSVSQAAGMAGDGAGRAASASADYVGRAASASADYAGRAASASADYAGQMSETTGEYVRKAGRTASELIDREPLLLAGLGLALGTAIGAMLPLSRFEQEQFGDQAERLRDQAEEVVKRGMDEAKDVAARAYDAASEEAERQGLMPDDDGGSIVERVEKVVKSTAGTTEEAVREKLRGAGSEKTGK